jgi:RimJ/RimL family protein N-acetyltransferase
LTRRAEPRAPTAVGLRAVTTDRLTLRRLTIDDLDELAVLFAQREVWEFPYGRGMTLAETEAFFERQSALWRAHCFGGCATRERIGGRLIGIIGLSVPTLGAEPRAPVSVGWRLAPSAWGKGYATEGAAALVKEAFTTLRHDRVCCITQPENVRSVRVAERLGMSLVETVDVRTEDDAATLAAVIYESRADRHGA